jgi:hypothetical protein
MDQMIYVRDEGASVIDTDLDATQLSATLSLLPMHRNLVAIGGTDPCQQWKIRCIPKTFVNVVNPSLS